MFFGSPRYDDATNGLAGRWRENDDGFVISSRRLSAKEDEGSEDRREDRRTHQRPASFTRTTNSVPRTPMIDAGVWIRMAPGVCLTMLPETTASVPWRTDASNRPS